MSTLSTTLIVLVVAVLAGVGVYNLVQYRRSAPAPRDGKPRAGDESAVAASIPGLQRGEPTLGAPELPLHGDNGELADDIDPDSLPDELARITNLDKVVPPDHAMPADPPASASAADAGSLSEQPGGAKTGASFAAPSSSYGASPYGYGTSSYGTAASGASAGAASAAGAMAAGRGPAGPVLARASSPSTSTAVPGASAASPSPSPSMPTDVTGIVAGSDRAGAPRQSPPGAAAPPRSAAYDEKPVSLAPAVLNPVTDCIVEVRLAHPYPSDRLLGLSQSLRRVGAKPVLFEGWYASQGHAAWVPIAPGQPSVPYGLIRVGVLLANRHGPLNAMEFAEFTNGLSTLAAQLSTSAKLPEMSPVLEKARALDDACIELDAQVGLNVDASEPLSPSDLERLAREQRLVERGNNRYARLGPAGEVLFSVAQVEQPNRITFLLDVPRAPAAQHPWQALVDCAKATAVRMQGTLVDDEGRPLSDPTLEQIGEQLTARAEALELAGFPAGSPLALRLFN